MSCSIATGACGVALSSDPVAVHARIRLLGKMAAMRSGGVVVGVASQSTTRGMSSVSTSGMSASGGRAGMGGVLVEDLLDLVLDLLHVCGCVVVVVVVGGVVGCWCL